MRESNPTTLATYEEGIDKYIASTPGSVSGWQQEWIDEVFEGVSSSAKILEVGSGLGRDAEYIESKGFEVVRTDAADSFVNLLNDNGTPARKLNVITDIIETNSYDVIFASAVLLHLNRQEMTGVLDKFHGALTEGGRLAFSLKKGNGETWSDEKMAAPRYFCYWQPDGIRSELAAAGYDRLDIRQDDSDKWLGVIATKGSSL